MAIPSGARIGSYDITAQIGAGGMGEVYRATDSQLGRTVAIKVLPPLFADDPERVARFEREARTLAALNHPNIAHIYGLEQANSHLALVMELVEGPTLADRIAQGPLPAAEALPIARQIAEALESAHELGIVHRDLKPANIKVRPDGTVKVLDFGLAKAIEPAGALSSNVSLSPTITTPAMTQMGMLLGTASYMSPEQARGKPVDKRTDVWAFGCVLYEMLTGKRAFAGEEVTDVLARVLERDIDLRDVPETTPPAVRRLLRRCLAKDRKQRLSDIGVARLEIDEALSGAGDTAAPAMNTAASGKRERIAWAAAILAAAAIAGVVGYYARPSAPSPPEVRFEVPVTQMRFLSDIAISPDGRRVAFAGGTPNGREGIWIRALDSPRAELLTGTETSVGQSMWPSWSPDSRYILFAADGNLKKADVVSGGVQTLIALGGQLGGATWNRDDVIVFASNDHGLRRISASGGPATAVSERDASLKETYHDSPVFLPDGRRFLYLAWSNPNPENRAIYVGSLDSPTRTRLMTAESNVAYSQGRLLFMRGDTLVSQPFDAGRAQMNGESAATGIRVAKFGGEVGSFSIAQNGTLIYREATDEAANRQLTWLDRTGKTVKASDTTFQAFGVRLSPDGGRVALVEGNPQDVWIYDIARNLKTRLTTDAAIDHNPVWSPDGTRIVFDSHRLGADPINASESGLFEKPANGATPEQSTLPREDGVQHSPRDWSADGRTIVFVRQGQEGRWNLWRLPLDGDRKAVPYRSGAFNETEAAISPNGQYLAFTSNEPGRNEVIVQPFPDPSGGRWQISTEGGSAPRWRRDGRELFYIDLKGRIISVAVTTAGGFTVQQSTPLVQTPLPLPLQVGGASLPYDVTPDGQRFLMLVPIGGVSATPITVRLNWSPVHATE